MRAAVDATWARLEQFVERAETAVVDLRAGVRERRVPRVSAAIQALTTIAFDSARLLGRLDQDLEDRT